MKKTDKKKTILTDGLRRKLSKMKKRPDVNGKLKKHLSSIINELIRKDARKEAMSILILADKESIGEFLYYHYSDIGNVACLVIDSIKDKLVKKGKMKQKNGDAFGGWMKQLKKPKEK